MFAISRSLLASHVGSCSVMLLCPQNTSVVFCEGFFVFLFDF